MNSYKFLDNAMTAVPVCKVFGRCGGCTAQHMSVDAYSAWKEGQVAQILQENGISGVLEPIIKGAPYRRRIITLTVENANGRQKIGFSVYHSHEIVDLTECHIALPEIIARLADVKILTSVFLTEKKNFHVRLLWSNQGLDVGLMDLPPLLDEQRSSLIEKALQADIIRLSVNSEILLEKEKPRLTYGEVEIEIPPGAFVQADAIAEQRIAAIAIEHLKKSKKIIELFSGAGSFTFPLLKHMSVDAVEYDETALKALEKAYRNSGEQGLKSLHCEKRDLFAAPVQVSELNKYGGLLFDPPRAGAGAQVEQIAKSSIKKLVAVSCNIITLVQDLLVLVAGGYVIDKIIPIDQFLWSNHCEIVVLLSKKGKSSGWKL